MKKIKIAFHSSIWEEFKKAMKSDGEKERFCIILCNYIESKDIVKILPNILIVPSENNYEESSYVRVEVKKDFVKGAVELSNKTGMVLLWVHTHSKNWGKVSFSSIDDVEDMKKVNKLLPKISPIGSIVLASDFSSFQGRIFQQNHEPIDVDKIIGYERNNLFILRNGETSYDIKELDLKYDRSIRFYGKEAKKFYDIDVAIVGCGGTGHLTLFSIEKLGVERIFLIDNDKIEISNTNRLILAEKNDVGNYKVDKYGDLFSNVVKIPKTIEEEESQKIVQMSDVILGCVDNEEARLILNKLCFSSVSLYIDIGTGAKPEKDIYGGQIYFLIPGKRICFDCLQIFQNGYINKDTRKLMQELNYIDGEHGANPSVLSLNMFSTALALDLLERYVTGKFNEIFTNDFVGLRTNFTNDNINITKIVSNEHPECFTCNDNLGTAERVSFNHGGYNEVSDTNTAIAEF